jgi:hypothetical protein
MPLLKFAIAAKLSGAPSMRTLHYLAAKPEPERPACLVNVNGVRMANTDDATWQDLLARSRGKYPARKPSDASDADTSGQATTTPRKESPPLGNTADDTGNGVSPLFQAKLNQAIAESQIKEFKAKQEEIKLKVTQGKYVDADLMKYYLLFYQRMIDDCLMAIRKTVPDLEAFYLAKDSKGAEQKLIGEAKRAFENVIAILLKEIDNSDQPQN